MSVSESSKVRSFHVRDELDGLDMAYKKDRAAALAAVRKPYQERRKKLTRLLDVLQDEAAASNDSPELPPLPTKEKAK